MMEPTRPTSGELLWIGKKDPLPDVCVTCGMFTDQRVTATYVLQRQKTVGDGNATATVAAGCLLHLLGPIGWLLSMLLLSDNNNGAKTKTVSSKVKTKIPHCRFCRGQQRVVPANATADRFAFEVHPRFRAQFEITKSEHANSRNAGDRFF